jgi:hypothetical protein
MAMNVVAQHVAGGQVLQSVLPGNSARLCTLAGPGRSEQDYQTRAIPVGGQPFLNTPLMAKIETVQSAPPKLSFYPDVRF